MSALRKKRTCWWGARGGRAAAAVMALCAAMLPAGCSTGGGYGGAGRTVTAPAAPPVIAAPVAAAPAAAPVSSAMGGGAVQPEWMSRLDLARRPAASGSESVSSGSSPPAANSSTEPTLYAESAIMIDARTGRTLFEKNADTRRAVASTQKLLTALLVVERGGLEGRVTTAASDTRVEPTKLAFGAGESYTRRALLNAMMVKSSNDAAEALGRDHSGSRAAFAAAMNARAAQLGAHSSHFVNPHGLTEPGQYSTARDIARIAHAAYRDATLRQMMRMPSYTFQYNNGRTATLKATNRLLIRSDVFNGMKTGYTNASGRCLVSSMSHGGRDIILVQLGSRTKYIFEDAARLMRWGWEQRGGTDYARAGGIDARP